MTRKTLDDIATRIAIFQVLRQWSNAPAQHVKSIRIIPASERLSIVDGAGPVLRHSVSEARN